MIKSLLTPRGGPPTWLDEVQADSPIGLWLLQETSGTTLTATTGNNGSYSASDITYAAAGPGKLAIPKAAQFGGTSSSASIPVNMSGIGRLATVCFWLYWDAFGSGSKFAVEFTASLDANVGSFAVLPDSTVGGSTFCGLIRGTAGYYGKFATKPSAAAWHHVAMTMDRTTPGVTLYIDGSAVGSTFSTGGGGDNFANSTLYLMSRAGSAFRGAGRMAGLSIHPSILSAARIAAHIAGA